jgi:TonB family protein
MARQGVTLRVFFLVSLLIQAAAVYSWERYGPSWSVNEQEINDRTLRVSIISDGDLPYQDDMIGSGEPKPAPDETGEDGLRRTGEEDRLDDYPGERTLQEEGSRVVLKPPKLSSDGIDRIAPRSEPLSDRFMGRLVSDLAPQREDRAPEEMPALINFREDGLHSTAARYLPTPFSREAPPRGSIRSAEISSSRGVDSMERMEFSDGAPPGIRYLDIAKPEMGDVNRRGSGRGVDREARLLRIKKPAYPYYDRRKEHEGEVLLEAYVLADGRVGAVEVVKSSKHKGLDSAAVKALRKARFSPAVRGAMPVPSRVKISFKFLLEDER